MSEDRAAVSGRPVEIFAHELRARFEARDLTSADVERLCAFLWTQPDDAGDAR